MVLRDYLTSLGCNVIGEAKNIDESIEKYTKSRPDFVVVDAVVPDVDGVAAVARLIRLDGTAKILVCVTRGQQSLGLQALSAGAMDFVLKPINIRQLHKSIQNLTKQPDNLRFEG